MGGAGSEGAELSGTARIIRVADPADAAQLLEIYRPFVTDSAVSFELVPPTAEQLAERVVRTLERTPWLVYEIDGTVAGYAYASRHRDRAAYQWSVEVSAYVRPDVRRGGIARQLYDRLFEVLSWQGFYNAYAGITLPNQPSVRFHEALGFLPVGVYHNVGFKFGRWHDVAWYERALRTHEPPSSPPIPLSDAELRRIMNSRLHV
jgi:phosphinothricin acetyltransferase